MAEFRIAKQIDAPILAATRQKVWDATYRGIYPDEMIDKYDLDAHTARDRKRIEDPDQLVYLVMDEDECVGYLCIGLWKYSDYKDFRFCLYALYFLPPYQGQGLGRRAFEMTAAECRRQGYDKFFCSCSPHNRNAMAFYEHMGGVPGLQSTGHKNKAEDQIYYEFYLNQGEEK